MRHLARLALACILAQATLCHAAERGADAYGKLVAVEPALTAQWRFEGSLDDAKAVAPAQAEAGTPAYVSGPKGGKALALGTGLRITMGNAPKLDLPETTVEMWFKPTFDAGTRPNPCLIAKRADSAHTRFSIHLWADYSCLAVWNGKNVVRYFSQGHPLKKGEWFHLAVTAKGSDVRAYLDGLECRREGARVGFSATRGLPLRLGWPQPGSGEVFAGAIDELAIYSKALPPEDIEAHVDAMGAKTRITREQVAAKLQKERQEREARNWIRLAELMDEKTLFSRGEATVYQGEHLGAVELPVGGIGAGSVTINGKAARPVWQIFNNIPAAAVPLSFFAIRATPEGGKPVLRALQTEPAGPFPAMKSLTFRGEYPFGGFDFADDALPVRVSLETFNPLIPLDTRSSAIPCAITTVTVRNAGTRPVRVDVLATQLNAVGFTGKGAIQGTAHPAFGKNTNRIVRTPKATILHLAADQPKDAPGYGDMALAALDAKAWGVAACPNIDALTQGCTGPSHDAATPPTPAGKSLVGALGVPVELKPGESHAVSFVLTWHFPNGRHGHGAWGGKGNMYVNWWPSALGVASEVIDRFGELAEKTRRYHDALYASNLPRWLLDRISSQLVVLRSPTCFWTQAGYFGGWEGCSRGSGCCNGNCNHVWHYAQSHARVFPDVARLLREQELRHMDASGGISHRQPRSHPAFDGQCGGVLGAYREHLMSPDGSWLAKHWPSIKKATDYLITRWDKDGDGVLAGPQWNTLDGNLSGSTSWLGTLYLASLAAAEKMAILQGDAPSAARYQKIRLAGAKKQDASLFNGTYYIQLPDPKPQQDYNTGCHIDQVLGQWWAHQLDLGWLYPPAHVRSALAALFEHNFQPTFHGIHQAPRKFVDDPDPGLQMITWPNGGRPTKHMLYADEVMSGFEYSAAAAMVQAGLLREGFAVVHAAWIRYDGRPRTGLRISGGWSVGGNPFCDDECGKYYARPMSIWSMLLACQGAAIDGPAARIGFAPVWKPDDHTSFFTAPEGWGVFAQQRAARKQTCRIGLRYGRLRVRRLAFQVPAEAKNVRAHVQIGERRIASTVAQDNTQVLLTLPAAIVIKEGETLAVPLAW